MNELVSFTWEEVKALKSLAEDTDWWEYIDQEDSQCPFKASFAKLGLNLEDSE